MRLYPDIPVRRANTAARDAATVIAVIVLALLGLWVYHTVNALTILGRGVHDAGTAVQSGFDNAADKVDDIPLAGGESTVGLLGAGEGTGGNLGGAGAR